MRTPSKQVTHDSGAESPAAAKTNLPPTNDDQSGATLPGAQLLALWDHPKPPDNHLVDKFNPIAERTEAPSQEGCQIRLSTVYSKYRALVRRRPDVVNTFPRQFSLRPSHATPVAISLWPPIFITSHRCTASNRVSARCLTGHDDRIPRLNTIPEFQNLIEETSNHSRIEPRIPLRSPTDTETFDFAAQDRTTHSVNGLVYAKVNPDGPTFQEVLLGIVYVASTSNNPNCHSFHLSISSRPVHKAPSAMLPWALTVTKPNQLPTSGRTDTDPTRGR